MPLWKKWLLMAMCRGHWVWNLAMPLAGPSTDFIQDILLVTQGPEYVSKIIAGGSTMMQV